MGFRVGADFYTYARNNAVYFVDPLGLAPGCGTNEGCAAHPKNPRNPAIQKLIDDAYKTYEECVHEGLGIKDMLKDFLKDVPKSLGESNKAGEKEDAKENPNKILDDARKKAIGKLDSVLKDCLRKNPLAGLACGPDKFTLPPGDVFVPLDPSPIFP